MMAEIPPLNPDEQQFTVCPFCTIQIPEGKAICPHCRQVLHTRDKHVRASSTGQSEVSAFRDRFLDGGRFARLAGFWESYGKWIKVAGPVMAGVALVFLVYGVWVDFKVSIVPNPQLPIRAKKDRKDNAEVLTVYVTNEGEDIPDLSLKSIGIVAEFVYRDGRRDRKTVFPKAAPHGEGALLNGETGSYEMVFSSQGLKEIVLRSEVVDLGTDRRFIPSRARSR